MNCVITYVTRWRDAVDEYSSCDQLLFHLCCKIGFCSTLYHRANHYLWSSNALRISESNPLGWGKCKGPSSLCGIFGLCVARWQTKAHTDYCGYRIIGPTNTVVARSDFFAICGDGFSNVRLVFWKVNAVFGIDPPAYRLHLGTSDVVAASPTRDRSYFICTSGCGCHNR